MAFKLIVAFAVIAVASGSGYAPLARNFEGEIVKHTVAEFDPHPQYTLSYGVNDIVTGDSKGLTETRDGDIVRGEYSLVDADGFKRIVKYTADDVNGFNAVVDRQPLHKEVPVIASAPLVAKSITPVTYAAPSLIKATPIEYTAPTVFRQAHSAPTLIKSVPTFYENRPLFNPTLAYSSGSPILRSFPFAANEAFPNVIRSADIAFPTPAHTLLRSAPLRYAQW